MSENTTTYIPAAINSKFIPDISIISIIYKKEEEIGLFLKSICEQSFPGNYEIVLVNDNSPDNSISIVNEYVRQYSDRANIDFKIIHNSNNLGNCESRNTGIKNSSGPIIIIIDADCVVNRDFLTNHYNAYKYDDCDAAVGYTNIHVKKEHIADGKDKLEKMLPNLPIKCIAQDIYNPCGFLNCVTRNFSIRRAFIGESDLFDVKYSYSSSPDSGFGWEDIEMGYRLYKKGVRIKFLPNTFSIHCVHPPTTPESDKPQKSLKNFRRLIENNPELIYVSRKWVMDTFRKIADWTASTYKNANGGGNTINPAFTNPDITYLDSILRKFNSNAFFIKTERKLNILTYRWHCGHQYELYKSGHNFTLVTGTGTSICNGWDYGTRPLPLNAKLTHVDKITPSDYDLAILHFDENCLSPQTLYASETLYSQDRWGDTFKWFKENVNIPRVAICHGTPQFHNQYTAIPMRNEDITVIEEERRKLVDFMGDTLVVVNSHQAEKEWGFKNSKTIWHGFDPSEFPISTYAGKILTLNRMKDRPHYRGYFLFMEIMEGFPIEHYPEETSVPIPEQYKYGTYMYSCAKYRSYIDTIRKYSIYLNPTYRSPMPRSRGEAMMCGLVTVSANNHDVDMFIKNTVNGFYSNNPAELREYLLFLIKNPHLAIKIGNIGRNLALDIFNHDRYLKEWENIYKALIK